LGTTYGIPVYDPSDHVGRRFTLRERDIKVPGTIMRAKEATVNGCYTSAIGLMQDLEYQGARHVDGPGPSCAADALPACEGWQE
jgi:hypothetical protein